MKKEREFRAYKDNDLPLSVTTVETQEENELSRGYNNSLSQRIYKLDVVNKMKSVNYDDLDENTKKLHEVSLEYIKKNLGNNIFQSIDETLNPQEKEGKISKIKNKNNETKNYMSCYFVLLDKNDKPKAFKVVKSLFNTKHKDDDSFSRLKSLSNHLMNFENQEANIKDLIEKKNDNENQVSLEIKSHNIISDKKCSNNNKSHNSQIFTHENINTFNINKNSTVNEALLELKKIYDSKVKSSSPYYIRNEWFLSYYKFMKKILRIESKYLDRITDIEELNTYHNDYWNKIVFFPLENLASFFKNTHIKKKIKELISVKEKISHLQFSLVSSFTDLKSKSSDLCHTESYIAVSLLNLLEQNFELDDIDWDSIFKYARSFIADLKSALSLEECIPENKDLICTEKDARQKIIIFYESTKECCSICKITIYMINSIYKLLLEDFDLYSFFRFKTYLSSDQSTNNNDKNYHSIRELSNLLTSKFQDYTQIFKFEKAFYNFQFQVNEIFLSKDDYFESGGEYFQFKEF